MTNGVIDDLKCDVLLFFATQTEQEQLENGANELGIPFKEMNDSRIGRYFNLETIGAYRVRAVKTRMGAFFFQGSASQAILLRAATSATAIIQVGMAFGIDRKQQKHGDVVISEWLYPYDYKIICHNETVEGQAEGYSFDYGETKPFFANQSLVKLFKQERREGKREFQIHMGGILSGGSRIRSKLYLDELLATIGKDGRRDYVGGEMEGVGLLASNPRNDPCWIIVKGISDFADHLRDKEIEDCRPRACLNAARCVLSALKRTENLLSIPAEDD